MAGLGIGGASGVLERDLDKPRPPKRSVTRSSEPPRRGPVGTKRARRSAPEQQQEPELIKDPATSAEAAGLRYISDTGPGITRRRAGKHFSYLGLDGAPIRDRAELDRIKGLGIPPAWKDVWICPDPVGHIQATGRDAKGRKQYRYHPRWREIRDETKYDRMIDFAKALPKIRARVEEDMRRQGLSREKVLATVVRLLETTRIRVGNDEYARDNKSFGLTTLKDRHADIGNSSVTFEFRGKSGKRHKVKVNDRRLARIVKACQDIPGQELFQYYDEAGRRRDVTSQDVNDYLREIAGGEDEEFTAKDFRTWSGTVLAALALREFEAFDSQAAAKRNVTRAIERVAAELGNTPAVCRKCYVHPEVVDAYFDGTLLRQLKEQVEADLREEIRGLTPEEAAVLAFLQQRLAREVAERKGAA